MKFLLVNINKKSKIFQTILLILILSILSYFLVFSKTNYEITLSIIDIFISTIMPSLFPFILFSNILIYSNYFYLIVNTGITRVISWFFKTPIYSASAVIFGFLFGYPNGARYVNELYESKKISFKEAEYLLLFINNSSPAFVLSSIGVGMFENIKIGILLLISHILASILIGKIFSYINKFKNDNSITNNNNPKILDVPDYSLSFEIITKSITKSIYTMCMIFGFMVIFILSTNYTLKTFSYIFDENQYLSSFLLSSTEITSGLKSLINLPINLKTLIVYISFFLGFSSFSIIFQIFSCVYKNNFKLKNILKGKLLHGILSAIITYVLISIPRVYEYINVSKNVHYNINEFKYTYIFKNPTLVSLIIFIAHILIFFTIAKKKRLKNRFSLKGG